jgi:glycosyltransferase involved in cell wall biosynthesis
MSNKKLILFTASFPFGRGETFIENEITFLEQTFSSITIVSNNLSDEHTRALKQSIELKRFPYHLNTIQKWLSLSQIFNPLFLSELKFIVSCLKVKPSKTMVFTILAVLQKKILLKKLLTPLINGKQPTLAYAYWSDDMAVALAMLKDKFPNFHVCCRAHRWDVYYNPKLGEYLPFRRLLAERCDRIFFISENAKNFFIERNKIHPKNNLTVSRLGTLSIPACSREFSDEIFHIVSCAALIPRKRITLLAEAISHIKTTKKIVWTHFGDGEEMEKLKVIVHSNAFKGITVHLKGNVPNHTIREFYTRHHIHLFINVSSSEGVPVSIMEAMSAAIPVVATDVDAVSEIVNERNGRLLPVNSSAPAIAKAIEYFITLPADKYHEYCQNAYEFWKENYNAEKNFRDFAKQLSEI